MSIALRLAGEVQRAAELIDPVLLGDHPTYEDAAIQGERASLDMPDGRRKPAERAIASSRLGE